MNIVCNNCSERIEIEDGVKFLTCLNCSATLEVISTKSSIYTKKASDNTSPKTNLSKNTYEKIRLLDNAWENEKEKYKVKGTLPIVDEKLNYFKGAAVIIFGVAWTIGGVIMTIIEGSPAVLFFGMFGIAFIVIAIWNLVNFDTRLKAYKKAESEYLKERKTLEYNK